MIGKNTKLGQTSESLRTGKNDLNLTCYTTTAENRIWISVRSRMPGVNDSYFITENCPEFGVW